MGQVGWDRSGQVRRGLGKSEQVRTGQERSGHVGTGRVGQVRIGNDRKVQGKSSQNRSEHTKTGHSDGDDDDVGDAGNES